MNVATAWRRLAAFGSALDWNEPRVQRLERFVQNCRSEEWDARAGAAIAWAASTLRRPQLLTPLLQLKDSTTSATFSELAVFSWSLGHLGLGRRHGVFLSALAHSAAAELETVRRPKLALDVLHGIKRLPSSGDEKLPIRASHAQRRLSSVNPASVTRLMVGFAKANHIPPLRLSRLLQQEASRQMALFSTGTLTSLIWAHARMGCRLDENFAVVASQHLANALGTADFGKDDAKNAATLLWAFARLRCRPDDACLRALDAALGRQCASLTPGRLLYVVHALGALNFRPTSWSALVDAIAALPHTFRCKGTNMGHMAVGAARLIKEGQPQPSDDKLWTVIDRSREWASMHSDDACQWVSWALACAGRGPRVNDRWIWLPARSVGRHGVSSRGA